MRIQDIQIEKLKDTLYEEGIRRGVTVNPFDVSSFIDSLFAIASNSPGMPLANPVIQEARKHFDLLKYNEFVKQAEFDIDVLFSFFSRARIEARNTLVYNDVEMKRMDARLEKINNEVNNFLVEAETPNESKFSTTTKTISFKDVSYITPQGNPDLTVDGQTGEVYLNLMPNMVSMDTSFLSEIKEAVTLALPFNVVKRKKEPSNLGNLVSADATPWLFEVDASGQVPYATIVLTIPLPYITKLNYIQLSAIPGATYVLRTEVSSTASSWQEVGYNTSFSTRANIFFEPRVVDRIRFTITAASTVNDNLSSFIFGLTHLQLASAAFAPNGAIEVNNIDVGIVGRPILSASMLVDQVLPNNTDTQFFLSLGNGSPIRVEGKELTDNNIEFSIVKNLSAAITSVQRTTVVNREVNSIKFNSLLFDSTGVLGTTSRTFVPKLSEVWLGQGMFNEEDYPDYQLIQVEDAPVTLAADKEADIIVGLSLDNLGLNEDANGKYISLSLPLAFQSLYNQTITSETDVKSLMKTSSFGVYKVSVYNSKTPDKPTIINSRVSLTSDSFKVYVSGSYAYDEVFSIEYNCKLTSEVILKKGTVKLHSGYGVAGSSEANQIPISLGKYQINYESNKIIAQDSSVNGVKYLNFSALFNTSKLKEYSTYIYVPETKFIVNLLGKIQVDQEGGEYAILRNEDDGTQIRLDNVSEIVNLKKGWYKLTVLSKPYSSQPSAIKSILEIKDNPGVVGQQSEFVFSLTSSRGIISKLGIWKEANIYVDREILFNETRRVRPNTYSSIKINDELHFIAPGLGGSFLKIDGNEYAVINLPYFPANLYEELDGTRVHSALNIKIAMENTTSSISTVTPIIKSLQLKVSYL